ncbi:MAG: hypothetical protein AAGK98_15240 [Pseudomonadota bacterium]
MRLAVLAPLVLIGCSPLGSLIIVEFEQGGYPDGGVLTGRFTGEDTNLDGKIRFDAGENAQRPEMRTFIAQYRSERSTVNFEEDDLRTLTWTLGADVVGASQDTEDGFSAINENDTGLTVSGPGLTECGARGPCGLVSIPGRAVLSTTFVARRVTSR